MSRIEDAIKKAQADHRYEPGHSARRQYVPSAPSDRADEQPSDVRERAIPQRHVGPVDNEHLREHRVIAASEHDERVGVYRQLRTRVLQIMRDNQWETLAITSAHEGAGKTLTASNLAISLSKDVNTSVLLVDLDLKKPTVHEVLNFKPDKGLVDFLEDAAELDEILFDAGLPRLTVLAGRSAGRYSSELLASPKMKELMRDLCRQDEANITIFDLPPLLRNDDAMMFAPYADATLIVVEDGVTTDSQLRQSLHLLSTSNVIGTILNKARF